METTMTADADIDAEDNVSPLAYYNIRYTPQNQKKQACLSG